MTQDALPLVDLPVAITMGDAAGIGPEIIARSWASGLGVKSVVYGDVHTMQRAADLVGEGQTIVACTSPAQASDDPKRIAVIACGPALPHDLPAGQISAAAGNCAYLSLTHAIDDAMAGHIRAIVTAPLNKTAMHEAGHFYPGHTEILAERSGTQDYGMMLANDELRVLLVTIHMALADVPRHITFEAELRTLRLAQQTCLRLGLARPRIAVAGLNPHAGEQGRFGREDIDIITPAIEAARAEGIEASGPWPGDTIFMRARRGEFDLVVAQYHDQGLIPVKYMGLDEGVNVTVGLPFIRTSVDHGTAFDIAWQGIADANSLHAAFTLALTMTTPLAA